MITARPRNVCCLGTVLGTNTVLQRRMPSDHAMLVQMSRALRIASDLFKFSRSALASKAASSAAASLTGTTRDGNAARPGRPRFRSSTTS